MNRRKKINITLQSAIIIGILLFMNLIASRYFKRIDLTEDGRYSISEVSSEMIRKLEGGNVLVTVYFDGEMPTKYRYLQEGIRTFLSELGDYSDGNLDYQFIDPTGDTAIFNNFYRKGYEPFRIMDVSNTSMKDQFVLPYAEISWKGGEGRIVNLVKGCIFNNVDEHKPDINIDKALQNLEYNIISTIHSLTRERTANLGLLEGHGEYPKNMMADLYPEIDEFYNILKVNLRDGRPISPKEIDVLLVMQPDSAFTEREKYEIDQYVMRGGKIIFLMDHELIDFKMDNNGATMTKLRDTRMDDYFMKMGVVINYELVEDIRCGYLDAAAGSASFGNTMQAVPWTYHPLIFPRGTHPVVRNVSDVLIRFGASIDTFPLPGIKKTPLIVSSPYTKRLPRVQFININEHLSKKPDKRDFRDGQVIFGISVGGNLRSAFQGKEAPVDSFAPNRPQPAFIPQTQTPEAEQIAIIADGEFALGEVKGGRMFPLPSDNKTMMMNLIDYFSGQEILTKVRVRKMVTRTLNPQAYFGKENFIQVVNIIIPLILVIAYGLTRHLLRTRRNKKLDQSKIA